ncbi:unnamed protein product [Phytophthora fragariaefolia]|uniref:Unnamed protein product n=1 Tax=Phytophthora fragariaefolia TaxID=1490495 RepID=A0A9W7D4B5_9STRA|nr:unnamed protein product [Phytophthora fragariaefolia]
MSFADSTTTCKPRLEPSATTEVKDDSNADITINMEDGSQDKRHSSGNQELAIDLTPSVGATANTGETNICESLPNPTKVTPNTTEVAEEKAAPTVAWTFAPRPVVKGMSKAQLK